MLLAQCRPDHRLPVVGVEAGAGSDVGQGVAGGDRVAGQYFILQKKPRAVVAMQGSRSSDHRLLLRSKDLDFGQANVLPRSTGSHSFRLLFLLLTSTELSREFSESFAVSFLGTSMTFLSISKNTRISTSIKSSILDAERKEGGKTASPQVSHPPVCYLLGGR